MHNIVFIQDTALAYCGQDIRLVATDYDVSIVTGHNPATNFTCVGSVKPLVQDDEPDDLSTEFVVSLSARTGHITRITIPISYPPTGNRPPRLHRRQLHASDREINPKIGAYKEYFVDTLVAQQGLVTINLTNISGNAESFADLDALFGVNTWSIQVQCGNLSVHNFTTTTPTTIDFITNKAIARCRIEFISVLLKSSHSKCLLH